MVNDAVLVVLSLCLVQKSAYYTSAGMFLGRITSQPVGSAVFSYRRYLFSHRPFSVAAHVLLQQFSTEAGKELKMSFSIYFVLHNIHVGGLKFSINLLFFFNNDPPEGKQLLMQVEMSILIPGSYHRLSWKQIPGNRWAEDKYSVPTASKTYQNSNRLNGSVLTWHHQLVQSG